MRLRILHTNHSFGTKVLFALIRAVSRRPVPDAARLAFYRRDFFGPGEFTQEAMRGPSRWSVADRELIAAYVSRVNRSEFCVRAHTATASGAYHDPAKVSAVLSNLETAPIDEKLRATLRMLEKLTRERSVSEDDMRTLLAAGVSREQIEDALAVSFAFNVTNRLADAFGFHLGSPEDFEAGAKYLLRRGYR